MSIFIHIFLLHSILLFIVSSEASFVQVSIDEIQVQKFTSEYVDQYKSVALHGGILYVGGRGRLYRLDPDNISKHLHSVTMWEESDEQQDTCMILPQGSRETCYNYIRNIQQYNETHLLICGTMALFPENMLLDIKEGTLSKAAKTSTPLCSYDPNDAVTSVRGGAAGSFPNIAGTSKILQGSMMLVKTLSNGHTIKTTQGQGKMLGANPKFTSSFSANDVSESGHVMKKLYFVYGEDADIAEGNSGFRSRIAQVCANDQGSQWYDRWTSFLKVSLLCQTNEATPFTFEVVTDSTITKEGILYATFTTRSSVVRASAVCAFKLADIQKAFHSNSFVDFSTGSNPSIAAKSSIPSDPSPGDCAYPGIGSSKDFTQQYLSFIESHSLVATAVQSIYPQEGAPSKGGTLLTIDKQLFTKIEVESVTDINHKSYDVIFVGTGGGDVIKFVSILKDGSVEEVKLADYKISEGEEVTGLTISSFNTLYTTTDSKIVQMATGNCGVYTRSCESCDHCRACVLARDPMCGWNQKSCVDIRTVANVSTLTQDVISGSVDLCGPLPTKAIEMKIPETGSTSMLGAAVNNPSIRVRWFNLTNGRIELVNDSPLYSVTADQRLEIKNFNQYSVGRYSSEHDIDGSLVSKNDFTFTDDPVDIPGISNPAPPNESTGVIKATSRSTVNLPVEPTNRTAPTPTDTVGVFPTSEPSPLSSGGLAAIIVIVLIMLALLILLYLHMQHYLSLCGERNKSDSYDVSKKLPSPQTSRSEDMADGPGSNNSNNSGTKYGYSSQVSEEQNFLLPSGKSSSYPRQKKVAEVQAVQANTDKLSSVPYMDEIGLMSAEAVTDRKPPKRTKSIPSQGIRIKLDNERDIKCNSIHRKGNKKGTYLVEIDLPDDYEFEDDDNKLSSSIPDLQAHPFIGVSTYPESDQIDEKESFQQLSNLHGRGDAPATDQVPRFPEGDTDSDSTLKAPNSSVSPRRAQAGKSSSSAAGTPRQPGAGDSSAEYPQLSSSYNSRLRGAKSSPKLSPRSQLAVPDSTKPTIHYETEQPQKLNAHLRKESTRSDKSPTSTASSTSNSSDRFQTPPSSPTRTSVA